MLIETFVFCGQNGLFHHIRDFPDCYDGAPLLAEFAQQIAFGRDDPQRNLRLVVGQCLKRGKCRPQQGQHKRAQEGADDRQAERYRH